MLKMKYIVVDAGGIELPFIFSEISVHADVARNLGYSGKVVGAGFVYISPVGGDPKFRTHGESTSLKIRSRREADDAVLNMMTGY